MEPAKVGSRNYPIDLTKEEESSIIDLTLSDTESEASGDLIDLESTQSSSSSYDLLSPNWPAGTPGGNPQSPDPAFTTPPAQVSSETRPRCYTYASPRNDGYNPSQCQPPTGPWEPLPVQPSIDRHAYGALPGITPLTPSTNYSQHSWNSLMSRPFATPRSMPRRREHLIFMGWPDSPSLGEDGQSQQYFADSARAARNLRSRDQSMHGWNTAQRTEISYPSETIQEETKEDELN
jgi:hypothetical protein